MSTFEALGINKDLTKGLKELNIITPTPIQEQAIPLLLNGNTDLVGQAQTGTGKTAAYGLPILQNINPDKKVIQALILCPTRELGQQVAKQLFKFTKYTEKIFTEAIYGGGKLDQQIAKLKRPTHIVVATPGRLLDLVKKKAIDLSHVNTVVLDEADEMLTLGFKHDLDKILSLLSQIRNKWLFSATMPHGIRQIVNQHMSPNAYRIELNKRNQVNKNIDHQYMICEEADKLNLLVQTIKAQGKDRGIVFCKTKVATKTLIKQLIAKNISADGIHGDLLQKERDKVMRNYKKGNLKILVATDLAARGIDVEDVNYVLHYQLPDKEEFYTHRSGRTARAGRYGASVCLVTTAEVKQLRYFEKALNISFKQIRF